MHGTRRKEKKKEDGKWDYSEILKIA